MAPKTQARSNLARSNACRSGWPVLAGYKIKLWALSNIARSNATRSNYTSNQTFISIGGVPVGAGGVVGGPGILAQSVTVNDSINDVPTTAQATFYKYVPVEGTDLIITLGSTNNLRREFGGTVVSSVHRYVGDLPVLQNMVYDAQLIDYSWGLHRKKVSGQFTNASVATIAAAIMVGAPGYTLFVAPDIGATILDAITFTEQTPADALHQLVKRVGGDWFCDYSKVIQVFYDFADDSPPTIINRGHTTFRDLKWTRDLSQVVTRVYGDVGGSDALDAVAVGATLIPVGTAAWYEPAGGVVLIGQQRVNYSGVVVGGGGSLVGPGAAPTGAPNAAVLPGAGVDVGSHDYAVTFATSSGESIAGPRLTVPVGIFLPPTTAPTAGKAGPGATGPDPGVHDYAVSFIISTGETVPGPRVAASTDLTPAPTTSPTPDSIAIGPGPDPGQHDYAVSFATDTGETPPGPIGGSITTGGIPAPTNAPSAGAITAGPGPDPGTTHCYITTFVRPEGETTNSPVSNYFTTPGAIAPPTVGPTTMPAVSGGAVEIGDHWYATTFVAGSGETTAGPQTKGTALPQSPVADPPYYPGTGQGTGTNSVTGGWLYYSYAYRTASGETLQSPTAEVAAQLVPGPPFNVYYNVAVTAYPSPDPAVTSIVFYRAFASGSQKRQWATSGNVQSTITDPCTNTTGALAPTGGNNTVSAGPKQTIPLTAIPTGPAGTTARKLYRSAVGSGTLKFLATITNNSTTTYTDTTADAGLGAAPPATNTALLQTVQVSGIQTAAAAAGVIARRLYRYSSTTNVWGRVATLNDNTTTSYTDTTPDAGLGPPYPLANTTTGGQQSVHLSGIPRGTGVSADAVTARKLFRRSAGVGLRYVATIPDNSTTTYTDTTANAGLGADPPTGNTATLRQIPLSAIPLGNSLVQSRKLYRTVANAAGSTLKLVAALADNVTTVFLDTINDAALGAAALTVGTAQAAQVQLSAIPVGAPLVIARKVYRSKVGATQLQLLTTINDNTTQLWLDVALDSTLGANVPIDDTSLLAQPAGNVLIGSPSLPCASVAGFLPTGGWVTAGSQNLRYTGISGTNLIGIPPSGPGSIGATLSYNTTIVQAAMLNGVPTAGPGTIRYPILKGDPVDVFVQVDDLDAQAAVRIQLPGTDGIIEDEIQDRRLSATEGRARARARLNLLAALDTDGKVGIVTVSYVCRDINTRAGRTVSINIGPPINLRGDFLIQRVTASKFYVPHQPPTYQVEASSVKFSYEELLRFIRDAGE